MTKLIIVRGNSGSGKTSIAKQLQEKMGEGTMLVQQDVVRREILRVEDKSGNPAIELIYRLCMYAQEIESDVIIEGILSNKKYGSMIRRLLEDFKGDVFGCYFDISFEETVRRHHTKPNAHEFGEEEMKLWWKDKDYLGIENEIMITDDMSQEHILNLLSKIANIKDQSTKGLKSRV